MSKQYLEDHVKIEGYVLSAKGNIIVSPPTNDNHKIDVVPDLRIDGIRFDFNDKSIVLTHMKDNKTETSPGVRNQIKDYIKNSVGIHTDTLRVYLKKIHERIADMFQNTGYFNKFDGSFRLSKFKLFENYIEIGFRLKFNEEQGKPFAAKTGRYNDDHIPNQEGIEFIVTENILNSVFYILYNLDVEFSWRQLLSRFGNIVEEHMRAGRISIAWEEIGKSYGYEKPIDFKCTFGKSLPTEIAETYPGVVSFNKSNMMETNFTMVCKILIEKEPRKWEVFKTLFLELNFDAFVDLTPSTKGSMLSSKSFIRHSIIKKLVIMKGDSYIKDTSSSHENVSKMINMNMAKAKYHLSMEIYDKTFTMPSLNECKSVSIYNPKVSMRDEYVVLSTNFKFKPTGIICSPAKVDQDVKVKAKDSKKTDDAYIKEDL